MRRHVLSLSLFVLALSGAAASVAWPQAQELALRRPRFVAAWKPSDEAVDVSNAVVLRRRVSLDLTNVTADEALKEITRQADLEISYSSALLPRDKWISVHAREITVAAALTEVLLDAGVDVAVARGGHMALVKRPASRVELSTVDSGTVAGRVTDKTTGAPIAGATVIIEGTRHSATTALDGRYHITGIPVGTHLVRVRYLGYAPLVRSVTVGAGSRTASDVELVKSVQMLDEVVTTGTVIPTEVRAVPTPISVITADDIRAQQLRRVDQVFRRNVPGSFSWDRGKDDIVNAANVRGTNSLVLPASGVKTYVDGIEVANDAFTLVDVNSVERIEILRGPEASTIYGSGASGGVMQIFTKKGALGLRRPQFEAGAGVGAVESAYESSLHQEYSASVRGGTETVSYGLGGSYERTGEWVPEYHLTAPGGYGGVRLVQGPLTVGLSARYTSRNVGQVVNPIARAEGYEPFQTALNAEATNRNQTYGINASYAATPNWQHNVIVGFDRFAFEYWNTRQRLTDSLFTQTISQQEEKVSLRYNTSASFDLTSALSTVLTAGAEYYRLHGSYFAVFGSLTNEGTIVGGTPGLTIRGLGSNTGYFAQARLDVRDAVFVTAGVRAERNSAFGTDFGTAVAPRVGVSIVQGLGPVTAKLRGSYGEALRPPAYGSNTDQPGLISNPNLGPEEQVGGEVGGDLYFGADAALSVTYYDQTARGLIDAVLIDPTSNPFTYQYQNVGRVKNSGVELEGRLRPGRLDLSATFSITNSTVRELGELYTGDLRVGDRLLGIPKLSAGTQASYALSSRTILNAGITHIGGWTNPDLVALYGFIFGGQEFRGSNRAYWMRYPSVTKLNAGFQQSFGEHLSFLLAVDNLTNNHRFEEFNLAIVPGRRTTVSIHLNY